MDGKYKQVFAISVEHERILIDDRRSMQKNAESLASKYKFSLINKEEKTE